MSTNATAVPLEHPIPNFPCPNRGSNLLAEGFYNSCTETTRVHADNRTYIVNDHLYMDHDEETLDTIDHECDLDAYCSAWALYQIRELDGITLSEAPAAIAELLAELEGDSQIASA
jgi:hypothetical protein